MGIGLSSLGRSTQIDPKLDTIDVWISEVYLPVTLETIRVVNLDFVSTPANAEKPTSFTVQHLRVSQTSKATWHSAMAVSSTPCHITYTLALNSSPLLAIQASALIAYFLMGKCVDFFFCFSVTLLASFLLNRLRIARVCFGRRSRGRYFFLA
jgi:hypothetical protein